MAKRPRFYGRFRTACLTVAEEVYGRNGVFAYELFSFINEKYFDWRLPWPNIIWGLTAHGGCVAWASSDNDVSRPPIINIHPSLWKSDSEAPWGIPRDWLGPLMVFDTLLHECIHIHIDYNLGGHNGRTSHDCPRWVRQVNRLAPLLGFSDVKVGVTKTVRVKDESLPRTKRGKIASRVVRQTLGNVPFSVAYGFPQSLRNFTGTAERDYTRNRLPDGMPRLE